MRRSKQQRIRSAASMSGMMRNACFCLWASIIMFSACDRRPLEDPGDAVSVQVSVDVRTIPNVTTSIYNAKIPVPTIEPEMMRVLFYNKYTKTIAAESYISDITTDEDGNRCLQGTIGIRPGTYEMLIYNFDTESTQIRNDQSFATIEAFTSPISASLASRFQSRTNSNTDILYEPDHLVVARNEAETIPYHEDVHVIRTVATTIVETYYLQIKVQGLSYVSGARAILNGMVGTNRFGKNERVTDPPAAIYFTLQKSDDNGVDVLATIFNTFGRIDNSTNNLSVTFDIRTTDGRTIQRDFDISHLFSTEACIKHHWLLLEETITIDPPTTPNGGGFDPKVDDWEDERHDIDL